MSTRMVMVGLKDKDLSAPLEDRDALVKIKDFTNYSDRDYRLRRRGSDWGATRSGPATFDRVKQILPNLGTGDVLIVQNTRSGQAYIARVVEVGPHPIPTTGNDRVDLLFGAIVGEFDNEFDIINMGAYVNKPGEHGAYNAIDVGVRKPKSADGIHDAIREIANWERDNVGRGQMLPVNGIIVMYEWCERQGDHMSGWMPYHGTPHVSHAHQSAWPNLVPGWV